MERWRLSPRTCTPSPGQCRMCQRHLWQWRAAGGLTHQQPDISRTTDTRTGHSNARGTQRQRWPPCDLRSDMIARVVLQKLSEEHTGGDSPFLLRLVLRSSKGLQYEVG